MKDNVVLYMFITFLLFAVLVFLTSGCTYAVTCVHTEGYAEDVVDKKQSAQPDISPNLTIPASVL